MLKSLCKDDQTNRASICLLKSTSTNSISHKDTLNFFSLMICWLSLSIVCKEKQLAYLYEQKEHDNINKPHEGINYSHK